MPACILFSMGREELSLVWQAEFYSLELIDKICWSGVRGTSLPGKAAYVRRKCSERGKGNVTLYAVQNLKKWCMAALYIFCVVVC